MTDEGLADPELEAWVFQNNGGATRFDVQEARAAAHERALARTRAPMDGQVTDTKLAGPDGEIAVRVYHPGSSAGHLIVYLHGGMWMLGDLETHDRTCRKLAAATGARVIAAEFRLAPEHPWPAAVDDAETAVTWACNTLGAEAPVIAGDSSGGHLALLVALRLRDRKAPCRGLILACPNTDLRLRSLSAEELGHGWGLDVDTLRWAVSQWIPPGVRLDDPAVSPLLADLTGLPPTAIVTADHDPLRDEGDALAVALSDAGVDVLARRERGMVHGFVQNLDLVSPAAAAATARWHRDACWLLEATSGTLQPLGHRQQRNQACA